MRRRMDTSDIPQAAPIGTQKGTDGSEMVRRFGNEKVEGNPQEAIVLWNSYCLTLFPE